MKVSVTKSKLDSLAVSIALKSDEQLPLTLDEMKSAVDGIQTGGGGIVITDETNATGTTAVVTGDEIELITKSITQNGTYNASSDNADGYSSVVVNVSGGSPSATQHTIYLEFSDNTNTTIPVYYNDSAVGSMITQSKPVTYGQKTVTLAQLDGVTWYEPVNIPIGVELIDYTKLTQGYAIDDDGDLTENEWSYASDYTEVDPSMTFSYTGWYWYYIGVYDDNKVVLRTIYCMTDSTQDPEQGNNGHGTLSGYKLSNAKYIRISGSGGGGISLIRTA